VNVFTWRVVLAVAAVIVTYTILVSTGVVQVKLSLQRGAGAAPNCGATDCGAKENRAPLRSARARPAGIP
jgi:hypothetical protein